VPHQQRPRVGAWAGYVAVLALLFSGALVPLMRYAAGRDLHSHILLVPLVTAHLLYSGRKSLPAVYRTSAAGTLAVAAIGLTALVASFAWRGSVSVNDHHTLTAFAFVNFVAAGGFLCFGSRWMAAAAFPFSFLIFMVPLPDAAVNALETASKLASADAAAMYFSIAGTTLVRDGTIFELPGITLEVAQECSGIRSSWVLFITSVLAGHLFLKSPWRKLVLVAFVIPLGILRNGFRVFVIGLLCVYIGPHMIDSVVHRQGGPFFFALSLVPLFLLLWGLWRRERRAASAAPQGPIDKD
jgi:exosortase C (VPDSG-CTERM-specific)